VRHGVKVVGGGLVPIINEKQEQAQAVILHLKTVDGTEHTVIPELLAKLSAFSAFRPRDGRLCLVLRNLALDWVRKVKLSWLHAALVVPSTVVLGASISPYEEEAVAYAASAVPGLLSSGCA
jgi:hypothetical protein